MKVRLVKVYYFGCMGEAGHFLWSGDSRFQRESVYNTSLEWMRRMDGVLPPQGHYKDQQCKAAFHFIHNYSVIAFWDQTVDTRPGSNSVFFVEGVHTFDQALEIAKERFPSVFARLPLPVERVYPDG